MSRGISIKMIRRRLIWYLYPAFLGTGIVVLLAIACYAARSFHVFYYNQTVHELEVRARLIEHCIVSALQAGDYSQTDTLCKMLGRQSITRITVILPDGRVVGDSEENPSDMEDHSRRPEFVAAMNAGWGKAIRFSRTVGKNTMYLAIPVKQNDATLAVIRTAIPVTQIEQELTKLYARVFWAGVVIAVCAAAVSWYLSQKISRPIKDIKETAMRMASGDFSRRLSPPSAAELAELSEAVNGMASQISSRIEIITEDKNCIQAILSSMIEGVIAFDSEGIIVWMNKAAAALWEIDEVKSLGRNVEEVIRNPAFQEFAQKTLQEKEVPAQTVTLNATPGPKKLLQLHGTALDAGKDGKKGAVIVMHDVTQLHKLEEIRRDFVANVSHELKTPITSIKGFVETLQEGAIDDPQEARRFLEIIQRHADRLNAIVDDLLTLSRLEEDSENRRVFFETVYLRPILAAAIELSEYKANKKNIPIELRCEEGIAAKINPALIQQAVFNLIDNAVKYSPDHCPVTITVQQDTAEILISVSDKGCGIEEQHLTRIFERFYVVDKSRSRKLGGTGLGLSIVKHIAQVHGGFVTVHSRINEGSTFTIHLPGGGSTFDKIN